MPDGKSLLHLAIGIFAVAIAVQVVITMLAPYKYWIIIGFVVVVFAVIWRRVVKAYKASGGSSRFMR